MKRLASILILGGLIGVVLSAQSRGTPNNLRVNIDANGYLLTATAIQTNPVTTVTFNNARLATDASGNLLVVCPDCGGSSPTYDALSIPFADALGDLTGVPDSLAFNGTTHKLLIGSDTTIQNWTTNAPPFEHLANSAIQLWEEGDEVPAMIIVQSGVNQPKFVGARSQGNKAAPTATLDLNILFSLIGTGHNGTEWVNYRNGEEPVRILSRAIGNWSPTNTATNLEFWTTPYNTNRNILLAATIWPSGGLTLGDSALDPGDESLLIESSISYLGTPCQVTGCSALASLGLQYTGPNIVFDRFATGTGGALIIGRHARGSVTAPTQTLSGDTLVNIVGRGWEEVTPAWSANSIAEFRLQAAENFTATAQGTTFILRVTPTGSVTPATQMTITSAAFTLGSMVAPALTGTRTLCISTTGVVTSSASACSGT